MSFVSQLALLCSREPTRNKWVFVPTHALGHTLGERVAREHVSWVNLRFVTPLDVAVRMAGPFLVEHEIDPSDEALGAALIMRLLLELPAQGGYFRPLGEQPSMATALWHAVVEVRMAGLRSTDLLASAFASAEKHRELTALLAAYERCLEERRVADAAMVFEEACRQRTYCPIAPADVWLEWPESIWPALIQRFLASLPGERRRSPVMEVPRLLVPRRCVPQALFEQGPSSSRRAGRLAWLMAPDMAPAETADEDDGSLRVFCAGGREAELDEVCRRILASGTPFDDIEIACGSETHALLAWEKATQLEWPVTVATGVPAGLTRPGRAALGWCDWVEGEFSAGGLRRLLLTGDLSPHAWAAGEDTDGSMTAGQGARLLQRVGAAWGKSSYPVAFARHRAAGLARRRREVFDQAQDVRDRTTRGRLDRLQAWVSKVLLEVPDPDEGGTVGVQEMIRAALAFLADNASRASVLDAAALVAIQDTLDELSSLGPFRATRRAVLRLLRERLEALRVGADRARPGCLHVTTLAAVGISGRGTVFVVGLEEGRVFPAVVEDPVLLDAEREHLSPDLRRSVDRLHEAVYTGVHRLALTGSFANTVCLSFSCRDTRECRETFPSWIVLQAFRLLRGHPSLNYRDLASWLGEPVSAVPRHPRDAHSDAAWWMAHARIHASPTTRAALTAFPFLERGLHAQRQRSSDELTSWDGHVPAAGPALNPGSQARALSVSTLEGAAACPFRFFLRHGLGVVPLEEHEPKPDVWLDPQTRGRELHELFAQVLRDLRSERRGPRSDDEDAITLRGDRRLAELRLELPPPSEGVFQAEREEFLHDLRLFIAAERQGVDREPLAFEVTFGLTVDESSVEPLTLAQPITLELNDGETLRVHGRIDRIDRVGDGVFETIDYKTGRYWADGWRGRFAGGQRLQHALYGKAAEVMLATHEPGARVVRNTYYFPTRRGLRQRQTMPTGDPRELRQVLSDLMAVLRAGTFVQATDSRTCQWCEFAAACGSRPWDLAGRKVAAAPVLETFRHLQRHE